MAVAQGEAFICVTDFPEVKLPWENFHGYEEGNKRIPHGSSRHKFHGTAVAP